MPQRPTKALLVPVKGGPPIRIHRDITVVGRQHEVCDILIDRSSVSKLHCLIVKTDGLLLIRDLGSTNGTKVNGQKVIRGALLPGDELAFAGEKFRVELSADDKPLPEEHFRTEVIEQPMPVPPELQSGETADDSGDDDDDPPAAFRIKSIDDPSPLTARRSPPDALKLKPAAEKPGRPAQSRKSKRKGASEVEPLDDEELVEVEPLDDDLVEVEPIDEDPGDDRDDASAFELKLDDDDERPASRKKRR